jgi:hypothetical protein
LQENRDVAEQIGLANDTGTPIAGVLLTSDDATASRRTTTR